MVVVHVGESFVGVIGAVRSPGSNLEGRKVRIRLFASKVGPYLRGYLAEDGGGAQRPQFPRGFEFCAESGG